MIRINSGISQEEVLLTYLFNVFFYVYVNGFLLSLNEDSNHDYEFINNKMAIVDLHTGVCITHCVTVDWLKPLRTYYTMSTEVDR